MTIIKKAISLILLFSLVFSFAGGIGTAYAAPEQEPEPVLYEDNEDYGENNGKEDIDVDECCDDDDDCIVENDETGDFEDPEAASITYDAVDRFVSRMYLDVLNRGYDIGGLIFWADHIRNGRITGADFAYSIFFSPEFINQRVSDSTFLDRMYIGLMDRGYDTAGKNHYMNQLQAGWPREDIFERFVNSDEFTRLCTQSGITRGSYTPLQFGSMRVFAKNMYTITVGREPEQSILNYWHTILKNGMQGASIAYQFIFSDEMHNRNLTDAQFVNVLYEAMLRRPADENGRNGWVNRLQTGTSRYSVFASFAGSGEFDSVCNSFGITRGSTPQPDNMMPGTSMIARVWNLIVFGQLRGISDHPEHVAGIIGNLQSEAGSALCPFQQQVSNQVGLGLMQWSFGRRTSLENYMWNSGIDPEEFMDEVNKHFSSVCSNPIANHPPHLLDKVLTTQINFMFHEFRNTWERQYMTYIDFPQNKEGVEGARAYAELFCAISLRPGFGAPEIDDIQDEGVIAALTASPHVGGQGVLDRISYSALNARRTRAANVYQMYLTNLQ